jgi:hypothetical protein
MIRYFSLNPTKLDFLWVVTILDRGLPGNERKHWKGLTFTQFSLLYYLQQSIKDVPV